MEFALPSDEIYETKSIHLRILLQRGQNVCITHELLKYIDEDLCSWISEYHYTMILDEVLDVIGEYDLPKDDLIRIQQDEWVQMDEQGYLHWNVPEYQHGRYSDVRRLTEKRELRYYKNSILLWTFPPAVFLAFDKAFVLTYMFSGSIMSCYCRMYNIPTEYWHIEAGGFCKGYQPSRLKEASSLISVYEGNLNRIGDEANALSVSWCKKKSNRERLKVLKNNTQNYFRNLRHSSASLNMWTCIKDKKNALKGGGYTSGFVAWNAKATNQYAEKKELAYLYNVYAHPILIQYLRESGADLAEEKFALSALLQWIWRSQIRKAKPVGIYVPSKRMRELLIEWMQEQER